MKRYRHNPGLILLGVFSLFVLLPARAQKSEVTSVIPPNIQEQFIAEKDASAPAGDADVAVSKDRKRVAWIAKRGRGLGLMINGEAFGPEYQAVGSPTFCGDGQRVAWAAKREKKWVLVVDGKELGQEYSYVKSVECSPDGKRIAHAATYRLESRGDWAMVVDGKVGPTFPGLQVGPNEYYQMGSAFFSPDSSRVAYLGWKQVGMNIHDILVLDGEAGPAYETILGPVFSADGKHVAYTAKRGKKDEALFVDGKSIASYEEILSIPAFSPDGKSLALMIGKDKKMVEVIDGQTGREIPTKRGGNFAERLTFSPDGKRLNRQLSP